MNDTLTYLKLILKYAALKSANTTMKCLLIVLGGAAFITEKPFYQQLALEGRQHKPYSRTRKVMQQKMRQRIYQLEKGGLIKKHRQGTRFWYVLTKRGEMKLLKTGIKYAPYCEKNKYIYVSYDIPEDFKQVRNLFRRFLYECGFRPFHKSVLVCDRDVWTPLINFVKTNRLESWVKIIRGQNY